MILHRLKSRLHFARACMMCAFSFLTIIPFRWGAYKGHKGNVVLPLVQSVMCWPFVGVVVASILAGSYLFLRACYVQPIAASTLAWGCVIILTGALHEDGWGDMWDSLGGQDKKQRLSIMRDSRVGSFGVIGLILAVTLRIDLLTSIPQSFLLPVCLASIIPAYLSMALLPAFLPSARDNGLSQFLKDVPTRYLCWTLLLSYVMSVFLPWILSPVTLPFYFMAVFPLVLLICIGAVVFVCSLLFGGYTGDVLGGLCVATQIGFLLAYNIALSEKLAPAFF